jgi:hypothetical protein
LRLRRPRARVGSLRFDDEALESRLVWMFGSPRSGTTWLLQLLVHALVPSGTSRFGVDRREDPDAGDLAAIPINEPYIPLHLTPPLFADSTDDQLASLTLNSFRREDPHYFLSDHYADIWRPQVRRLLLAPRNTHPRIHW